MDGFGHVNNSTYLTYLEEGRDEYITELVGETVHRVVIRRIEIDFVSGLTQDDDLVDVHVQLTGVGGSSVTLDERIVTAGRAAWRRRQRPCWCTSTRAARPPPDGRRRPAPRSNPLAHHHRKGG